MMILLYSDDTCRRHRFMQENKAPFFPLENTTHIATKNFYIATKIIVSIEFSQENSAPNVFCKHLTSIATIENL